MTCDTVYTHHFFESSLLGMMDPLFWSEAWVSEHFSTILAQWYMDGVGLVLHRRETLELNVKCPVY